jgi:hypothetical protein
MGWRRIGTVEHTDEKGNTWEREVARDDETGETDRQYGDGLAYPKEHKTSRDVGETESDEEALKESKKDLDSTF